MREFNSLGDVLALTVDELLVAVDEVPLSFAKYLASFYPQAHVRRAYLKRLGVEFADDSSFVNAGFTFTPNAPGEAHVRVGRNVSVAPGVTCVCDSCANNGVEINAYPYVAERLTRMADIVLDDECWIGANVTILPGVTVGRCAVVGAGAVVNHDVEPYGIYAGVPAKKIGDVRQELR